MPVLYRARWSFMGETRSLLDTGRLMARWSERALAALAPELAWTSAVQEHSDYALAEQWEASHVVRYAAGGRGAGLSELVAGGRGTKVGGSSRIAMSTVRPFAYFEADGHCDVEHWDVRAGGIDAAVVDTIRAILEDELGAEALSVVLSTESFERGAVVVASTADEEEARLWHGDLDDAGLLGAIEPSADGFAVRIESSEIADAEELESARVTLGEVLAEAGVEDWSAAADGLLARLPSADHSS